MQSSEQDDTEKFFTSLDSITNYFYSMFTFEQKVGFRRDYSTINVNRQLLIRNLGVHVIIFELLETNFYLL